MTTEHGTKQTPSNQSSTFQQLEQYPWTSDPEFQSGLQAILGPNPDPEQAEQLTLRARCFYFSRKNDTPIDFDAYKHWRSQCSTTAPLRNGIVAQSAQEEAIDPSAFDSMISASTSNSSTEPPAPYPISFSQIVELITTGQPIPGIKEVPNTLLEGQASQPTTTKRKKPWEKEAVESADGGGRLGSTALGVT